MEASQVDVYDEASIALTAGAMIVMYSDGLIERRGESLSVGLERLSKIASQHAAPVDLEAVAGRLVEDMTAGVAIQDDIVVVCARWQPAAVPLLRPRFGDL
jgi:serine phosphatase RsbU (regulator of sigma subunit)